MHPFTIYNLQVYILCKTTSKLATTIPTTHTNDATRCDVMRGVNRNTLSSMGRGIAGSCVNTEIADITSDMNGGHKLPR